MIAWGREVVGGGLRLTMLSEEVGCCCLGVVLLLLLRVRVLGELGLWGGLLLKVVWDGEGEEGEGIGTFCGRVVGCSIHGEVGL